MPSDIFDIHMNGNVPFKVEIMKNTQKIIIHRRTDHESENGEYIYDIFKIIKKYEYVFVPREPVYGYDGNSILIELSDRKYMYIGGQIYTFKTQEKIADYRSPMGNSDVPYPFAISKNYYYIMLDGVYYEKKLAQGEDPYGVYYGHIKKVPKIQKNDIHEMNIIEKNVE